MSEFWQGVAWTLGALVCSGIIGGIVFPLIMLATGGEPFSWLKDERRERRKRRAQACDRRGCTSNHHNF